MQGLTVQGFSPYRLTPVAIPVIPGTQGLRAGFARKNLVKLLIEPKTAIALVGHGLRRAAPTVRGHVQATLTTTALVRAVASMRSPESLTPTAAHPSDGEASARYDATKVVTVTLEVPGLPAMPLEGYPADEPFVYEPEEIIVDLSGTNEDVDVEF